MSNGSVATPDDGLETVVLLSVDSLRQDRLHADRDGVPLMPNTAALAADGLEATEGIAPAHGTSESVPAMLTGAYPSQFPGFSLPEPDTEPLTIAEHLQRSGFSCAAFNKNNVIARRYNYDRGFDVYHDISPETRAESDGSAWRLKVRNLIEGTPLMDLANWLQFRSMETLGRSLYEQNERGDSLTDRAITWLDETEGKRFLWLHYMDTHHPYVSSDAVQREFDADVSRAEILKLSRRARTAPEELTESEVDRLRLQYDCAVRFVDEQIGRVRDHLASEGELEDAMVVVTGDHGEEFLEHGKFGHRTTLWDELIRVPLVVSHPDVGARRIEGQAAVRSLCETVLDGAGWFDLPDGGAEYVVSENDQGDVWARSCRGNGYKLIEEGDERIYTRYDGDGERVLDESDVPDRILADLEDRLAEPREQYETGDVNEEQLREDLAALGYLDE